MRPLGFVVAITLALTLLSYSTITACDHSSDTTDTVKTVCVDSDIVIDVDSSESGVSVERSLTLFRASIRAGVNLTRALARSAAHTATVIARTVYYTATALT